MLNITTIEDALYDWVSVIAGVTTIFEKPGVTRPQSSYVTINIVQATPQGKEEHIDTILGDYSVDVDYSNLEELFVSINVYYAGALQLATKLKDSLGRITIQEQLFGDGLGYKNASAVREIDDVVDMDWEERAQFDCFFYTRSLDEENIEAINDIQITNEFDSYTTIVEHPDR